MEAKISCILLIVNNLASQASSINLVIDPGLGNPPHRVLGSAGWGQRKSQPLEEQKRMLPAAKTRKCEAQHSTLGLFFLSLPPVQLTPLFVDKGSERGQGGY